MQYLTINNEEAIFVSILVVMNTNELVVKIRPEKISSRTVNDAVELYCHKHILFFFVTNLDLVA